MTTKHMLPSNWSVRLGIAAMAMMVCASAFAGADKPGKVRVAKRVDHPQHYKICYAYASNSPFPQPCSRLRGIPSTASPMVIIGEIPMITVVK